MRGVYSVAGALVSFDLYSIRVRRLSTLFPFLLWCRWAPGDARRIFSERDGEGRIVSPPFLLSFFFLAGERVQAKKDGQRYF